MKSLPIIWRRSASFSDPFHRYLRSIINSAAEDNAGCDHIVTKSKIDYEIWSFVSVVTRKLQPRNWRCANLVNRRGAKLKARSTNVGTPNKRWQTFWAEACRLDVPAYWGHTLRFGDTACRIIIGSPLCAWMPFAERRFELTRLPWCSTAPATARIRIDP